MLMKDLPATLLSVLKPVVKPEFMPFLFSRFSRKEAGTPLAKF
jgi:hypothetical protein